MQVGQIALFKHLFVNRVRQICRYLLRAPPESSQAQPPGRPMTSRQPVPAAMNGGSSIRRTSSRHHRRQGQYRRHRGRRTSCTIIRTKVMIGHIAAADDRHLVVHRHRLVVHAPVNAGETSQGAQRPSRCTAVERIEYAHFEMRVRVQSFEANIVAFASGYVVEQKSNTNPPIRSAQQRSSRTRAPPSHRS